MDHLDALKSFRAGSSLSSVTSRVSLIDTLNEAARSRTEEGSKNIDETESIAWSLIDVDLGHINPKAALILRKNALSLEENHLPFNAYSSKPTVLPASVLDSNSRSVAEFLIKKFCVKEQLFDYKESDFRKERYISGPTEHKEPKKHH